jgi:hypothetical protein
MAVAPLRSAASKTARTEDLSEWLDILDPSASSPVVRALTYN